MKIKWVDFDDILVVSVGEEIGFQNKNKNMIEYHFCGKRMVFGWSAELVQCKLR